MDFHEEFEKSIRAYPCIEGLIFADPDGESILFSAPNMDEFDIKLAGAKMPIMLQTYRFAGIAPEPSFLELYFRKRFVISVCLIDGYTITVVSKSLQEKGRLRHHLKSLAEKFNQDIV